MTPPSRRPCESAIVGQAPAAVTVPGPVGVGVGDGAGVEMSMFTLPPFPGEAMSSGPQAVMASMLQPSTSAR